MEESYLTFMRICILGGDTFGAFRGDRIQEGTLLNFSKITSESGKATQKHCQNFLPSKISLGLLHLKLNKLNAGTVF